MNSQIPAVRFRLSWLQLVADQRGLESKRCGGNQAEGFACLDAQQRPRRLFEPLRNGPQFRQGQGAVITDQHRRPAALGRPELRAHFLQG